MAKGASWRWGIDRDALILQSAVHPNQIERLSRHRKGSGAWYTRKITDEEHWTYLHSGSARYLVGSCRGNGVANQPALTKRTKSYENTRTNGKCADIETVLSYWFNQNWSASVKRNIEFTKTFVLLAFVMKVGAQRKRKTHFRPRTGCNGWVTSLSTHEHACALSIYTWYIVQRTGLNTERKTKPLAGQQRENEVIDFYMTGTEDIGRKRAGTRR
ncbi:hypothetical protein BD410DRAFT_804949 [Rickenella mellea]|uniref:Uncharacterized protein n=1 Tax=Rickenella mellea TaxID=50990 RepID=A0A4Y7PY98_9AGAM|nr:hypothetical protein BD410DRAFT_804949 [Rickenella mellea]